jgi:serine/threonine protein kinase
MVYTITKLIKEGELSKIYQAENVGDINPYIIKILYLNNRYTTEEIHYISQSTNKMIKLLHNIKGLVNYKQSTLNNNNLLILSEMFKSITLDQFLKRQKTLTEDHIWIIIIQLIDTLFNLAKRKLYLVNIKNDNIFINDKYEIRLNYLSNTKILHLEDFLGNNDDEYKSCVFAVGYVILDLVDRMVGHIDYENSDISIELKSLITLCITKDSTERPSIFDIYENEFIKEKIGKLYEPSQKNTMSKSTGFAKSVDFNNKFFGHNMDESVKKFSFYNSIPINK